MPKFRVPPTLAPGVYRNGVGFFRPGETIELPDSASIEGEIVNLKLIPLDEDAKALLESSLVRHQEAKLAQRAKKNEPLVPVLAPIPEDAAEEDEEKPKKKSKQKGQTLREIGAALGVVTEPGPSRTRAADEE